MLRSTAVVGVLCALVLATSAVPITKERVTSKITARDSAGSASADLITSLPGYNGTINFKQYSGYLPANGQKMLHYWFVESQNDPTTDPVLLWLNGGPGCSSLDGLLSEHGPFHLTADGKTVIDNPYAWNLNASVIYLEAPAGVGFSYSPDPNDYHTDDITVASDNYVAMTNFMQRFPQFQQNDFYVTGESYGGVYVPTLTQHILQMNAQNPSVTLNLKGFAVGNGLSSYELNDDSLVYYAYYHGLFGDEEWNNLQDACCTGAGSAQDCNFHNSTDSNCQSLTMEAMSDVYSSGLNFYALYLPCDNTPTMRQAFDMDNLFRAYGAKLGTKAMSALNVQTQQQRASRGGNKGMNVPCINTYPQDVWLNTPEVQEALHIKQGLPPWSICSATVGQYYNRTYQSVIPIYQSILGEVRALVYNGDTDMACNFLGDQWAVAKMNQSVKAKRRSWHVNNQVAGFVEEYENLTFCTVKGAGHMVPEWKPEQALHMIRSFLFGTPY
eukprot:TRINITY_DN8450_c0_g1_i1.p1 TRINITY_DN8450_c0_g1~~TRINITY_DN8450_c0_g1_i1.p1  ORF type:complete len:498 (+),score=144.43 TRINITY_DN8450_c0_g1_i1:208-1701(+)